MLDAIAPRAVLRFAGAYLNGHERDHQDWDDGFAANAARQVRYLADRGHGHIATALPDNENPLGELRVRWASETVRMLGLPPLPSFVVPRPRTAGTHAVQAFPPLTPR